jgi:hypothetical protein
MHWSYKPTRDSDRRHKVKLVGVTSGKKCELSPFLGSGADFVTMRSMSTGCKRWVIFAVLSLMREYHARAQLDEQKTSSFWKLDTKKQHQRARANAPFRSALTRR